MKKLLLNILLLTLSTQVSASLLSSIENDDNNRYNKILVQVYEDGPAGEVFISARSQDDITQNVLSAQLDLPFSDYDKIFNSEETVEVVSKELSYKATGEFESRKIQFTVNEFQNNGKVWDRTIVSIEKDNQGFLVTMKLYTSLSDFRRFFYNDGLKLNSVTKTRLSQAKYEGINSYTVDGDLLGTTFSRDALSSLVEDKSFSSIQDNCEMNCIQE